MHVRVLRWYVFLSGSISLTANLATIMQLGQQLVLFCSRGRKSKRSSQRLASKKIFFGQLYSVVTKDRQKQYGVLQNIQRAFTLLTCSSSVRWFSASLRQTARSLRHFCACWLRPKSRNACPLLLMKNYVCVATLAALEMTGKSCVEHQDSRQ